MTTSYKYSILIFLILLVLLSSFKSKSDEIKDVLAQNGVIKMMPKFTPGMVNGKAVRTKFNLPIKFNLN